MLTESIATQIGTDRLFFSPTPRRLYHIAAKRDQVPPQEVRPTDRLRLLPGEEVTHPEARVFTGKALNGIIRGPKKTIAVAASRFINAFRASVVNYHHPHSTEVLFFCAYSSEDDITDLMRRLCRMLALEASNRVGNKTIVTAHVHEMMVTPKPFSVSLLGCMRLDMIERGRASLVQARASNLNLQPHGFRLLKSRYVGRRRPW